LHCSIASQDTGVPAGCARALARGAVPTRSLLEDVVYDLIVRSGFVAPEVNRPIRIAGRTLIPDFRWPAQQLIVEADGARWHDNALARAGDAERQALLEAAGETVLRVGWDEAVGRPTRFAKRLEVAGAPSEPTGGRSVGLDGTR
jgi:very-short-patch-repair endonuclease